jgi:signal transduction histidine kinase
LHSNEWFRKHAKENDRFLAGRELFEAFPDLLTRGFDRYYREALSGQTRILSHRFHKFLVPMEPSVDRSGFLQMPQSARISPLLWNDKVVGTISVIEDVTERVLRESELNHQIDERERLIESELSARKLAEENNRLKGSFETLRLEGIELNESSRERDRLMHRIIISQEEERKRVARDIHDHLGQQLTALRFALSMIEHRGRQHPDLSECIEKAQAIAKQLDQEVDYLAWELRPAEIDDIGLDGALGTLVKEWSEHYGISVELHTFGLEGRRLPADVEINLYRIAQESLNNISKHAKAKTVSVVLENRDDVVVLIIDDDGLGFDIVEIEKSKSTNSGLGLFGMRERAALIGATLEIESKNGEGTSVYARIEEVGQRVR